MPNTSCPSPQRLEQLLSQLVASNQELSQSLTHLALKTQHLSQNLDWVEGRILLLEECRTRLTGPEMHLTQIMEESSPDLMATLMMQRHQLKRCSQFGRDCFPHWQHGFRQAT